MSEVFSCAPASGDHGAPARVRRNGKTRIIDIHCHINIVAADEYVRAHCAPPPAMPFSSAMSDEVNRKQFAAIASRLNGVDERIADMDRLGIDIQAMSPSPGQYYYLTPPEVGREAARLINNGIADAVAKHPDRLTGICGVALQDPAGAVVELRRAVKELGFRGVEINSNVGGRELSAPEFRPFFAAAEELDVLVFIHPLGFTQGKRLSEHYLSNLIGNPLDSTVAIAYLIFDGVLERHSGLKICVAHGGGYLPGYWGRMDHAWRAREDCRQHIARAPSTYLRQLYLDTLVFDRAQLDFLIATHGADRLCMGSDYPFDMSEPNPVGFHVALPDDIRAKILGANAARLLKL
jgi:aminocarboxymuconate-semialdehyde decarboxylase